MVELHPQTKYKIQTWLGEHPLERMPEKEFRQSLHLSYKDWRAFKEECQSEVKDEGTPQTKVSKAIDNLESGVYNSDKWLQGQMKDVDRAMIRAAMNGNSNAMKLILQRMGLLIEKREDTVRFEPSASDQVKWGIELVNRLREDFATYGGICPVCSKPQILLDEVCVDSEPEHSQEG